LKKLTLLGGILGGTVLVFLVIITGALIWGGGVLKENLPTWVDGGQRLVSLIVLKAEEILPGIKDQVRQAAPGFVETVEKMNRGAQISAKDVSGEEINPVPRFPNMLRVSYTLENQKRMVVYKGEAGFATIIEFYRKEMLALGFGGKVVRARPEEEIHRFSKGGQELEFRFRRIAAALSESVELTVREL
jgi:hypothetical protein